jgi:hypothetical protein
MAARKLTPAELKAYAELAQAARRVQRLRQRAEHRRQRGQRDTATPKEAANA